MQSAPPNRQARRCCQTRISSDGGDNLSPYSIQTGLLMHLPDRWEIRVRNTTTRRSLQQISDDPGETKIAAHLEKLRLVFLQFSRACFWI